MTAGYDIHSYGRMVEDAVRMGAYHEALRRHVRPGSVVVELGSGPGVMALLACQLGAARVYAIEPDPSIELARRLADANGFGDRITCIRELSTEVELPERGDILLSDLRGTLPLLDHHIASIKDARERLLKPDGVQLPQRDRLLVGLARDDVQYTQLQRPWRNNDFGLDLEGGRMYVVSTQRVANRATTVSLSEGKVWGELDYRSVVSPDIAGTVDFTIDAGERVNSLEVWFEAEVCDGIRYSTAPDQPDQVYGRVWLPLQEELVVGAGESVRVELDVRLVSGQYLIRWTTSIGDADAKTWRRQFRQSTFSSMVWGKDDLRRWDPAYVPKPGVKTAMVRFLIERMDGSQSVRQLADEVRSAFPEQLRAEGEALGLVRDVSKRYCPDL